MTERRGNKYLRHSATILVVVIFVSAILLAQISAPTATSAAGDPLYGVNARPLLQATETPTNTPTNTNTPTPTDTSTPTSTSTSTATQEPPSTAVFVDQYEPNNSFNTATETQAGFVLQALTLWPPGDVDFFRFVGKAGASYEIFTKNLTAGLDTELFAYDVNGNLLASNDDYEDLSRASKVRISTGTTGFYFIQVINKSPADPAGRTYQLEIKEILGTATPTGLPTGTRVPSIDICERNNFFQESCVIELNVIGSYDFVPVIGEGPDNDFYRIWVKQGLFYVCETANLSSVNDTNMIFYSAPNSESGIAGNDDIDKAAGNLASRVEFVATYTGWLYVLVGPVPYVEYAISNLYTYDMICLQTVPTPTPTSSPTIVPVSGGGQVLPSVTPVPTFPFPTFFPTPTPLPPGLFVTPQPTPRPNVAIVPLPTATPATSGSTVVNLDITLYYDSNNNFMAELDEGIVGVSVAIYDNAIGELLAFGYTNEAGNVRFGPIATTGAIRVSVPFLNFSQVVAGGDSVIFLRIAPQPIPVLIP